MDRNKLDRLFREGTDNFEVTPSENSWKVLESQIRPSRYGWIYGVAASVVLIMAVAIVFYFRMNTLDNASYEMAFVDAPHPLQSETLTLPLIDDSRVPEAQVVAKNTAPTKQLKEDRKETVLRNELEIIELEAISIASIEVSYDFNQLELQGFKKEPTITIRYYTQLGTRETDDKPIERLGKWITKAQQVNPGELLASLRDAKDDFLSNGMRIN